MIDWTQEKIEILMKNYPYYLEHKKEAEEYFNLDWETIRQKASSLWMYDIKRYWTAEEYNELKNKYLYYLNHIDEAELYFKTTFQEIKRRASNLKLKYIKSGWTNEEIKNLKKNYSYYVEHIEEAKNYFRRQWKFINNKALNLGLIYNDWTEDKLNNLKENYIYYSEHKEEAELYFQRRWCLISQKALELEITSMKTNKNCPLYLGCHIAERVLSHVFKNVERMPIRNKGYDFICNKGFKIDVKSSCLHKNNTYTFSIKQNKIADYFLMIGFNNRKDLTPQHIWLIKGNEIINNKKLNNNTVIGLVNKLDYLSKYSKYELTDKLKNVIECCNELKNKN